MNDLLLKLFSAKELNIEIDLSYKPVYEAVRKLYVLKPKYCYTVSGKPIFMQKLMQLGKSLLAQGEKFNSNFHEFCSID